MNPITIIKQNEVGQEVWRYPGQVLQQTSQACLIEAHFDLADRWKDGLLFARGDRFVEAYFSDRWFNLYEIHARENDALRGWYCNVSAPAVLKAGVIEYRDLALDLLVFADGRKKTLDEDEFAALTLTPNEQQAARQALAALQGLFRAWPGLRLERDFSALAAWKIQGD